MDLSMARIRNPLTGMIDKKYLWRRRDRIFTDIAVSNNSVTNSNCYINYCFEDGPLVFVF